MHTPSHPGELLRKWLKGAQISATTLVARRSDPAARRSAASHRRLHRLGHGERRIRTGLAIKVSTKKIGPDMPTFSQGTDNAGFDRLGVTPLHTHAVAQLPQFDDYKDPFDRLLVAQSLSEPLVLLTTDGKLAKYGALVRVV